MAKKIVVPTAASNAPKSSLKARAAKSAAPATAAPAKGKATKPEGEAKTEVRSGINIGKTTGMRVMAYQDHTFAINDKPDRHLTDEELAADWRREFPESRAVKNGRITADMVRAVRVLYNNGTNGHGTPGVKHESRPYIVQDGKRVKGDYAPRTRKVAEPKSETATAADKNPAKKVAGKKSAAA